MLNEEVMSFKLAWSICPHSADQLRGHAKWEEIVMIVIFIHQDHLSPESLTLTSQILLKLHQLKCIRGNYTDTADSLLTKFKGRVICLQSMSQGYLFHGLVLTVWSWENNECWCNVTHLVFWFLLCLISPAELNTYTLVLCLRTHEYTCTPDTDHQLSVRGQTWDTADMTPALGHTYTYFHLLS